MSEAYFAASIICCSRESIMHLQVGIQLYKKQKTKTKQNFRVQCFLR